MANFRKGDILRAKDRSRKAGYHPVVFVESLDGNDFVGAMLTHSSDSLYENYPMQVSHFAPPTETYDFRHDNTFIVKAKLLKPHKWGPYKKCGSLSAEGLKYVESVLRNAEPIEWETYLKGSSPKSPRPVKHSRRAASN